MKKIYKCNLFAINRNKIEKYSDLEKLYNNELFEKFDKLTIDKTSSDNEIKKICSNLKECIIEQDMENILYKDDIDNNIIKEVFSDKNKISMPISIPISLDGRIYVTRTFRKNIVKEIITGKLFRIELQYSMKFNKPIIINTIDTEHVLTQKDYKELKYYLQNKEVVRYWVDSINELERKINNEILEEKENIRKQELEEQEIDRLHIEKYHRDRDKAINEVKELYKKRRK